jgi:hypothetical protein
VTEPTGRTTPDMEFIRDAVHRHPGIEERVGVYLVLRSDGWVVDGPTVDGHSLYGYDDGPLNEACEHEPHRRCRRCGADLFTPEQRVVGGDYVNAAGEATCPGDADKTIRASHDVELIGPDEDALEEECDRLKAEAALLGLPDAREAFVMLGHALGYDVAFAENDNPTTTGGPA